MANLNERAYIAELEDQQREFTEERLREGVYRRRSSNRPVLVKFESLPIRDQINNRAVQVVGFENPAFADGVSGRALRMRPKSGLNIPLSLRSRSRFSMGFWLRPAWLRPALSLESNDVSYYRMPLINYSTVSINGSTNFYESSTGFSVFEECLEGEQNILYVFMDSDDGPMTVRSTTPYSAGDFHHLYIAYNGGSRVLNIFIDGKESPYEFVQGSQIPSIFSRDNNTPRFLEINQRAPGFSGLVRNNFGTLDEFYFINQYQGSSETVARHINFGSEFVSFGGLVNQDQVTAMFGFDDPSSLDLTSVFSNGTNIYAGRSDGRVYKGDRLLWQSRRDFSNEEEINFVRKNLLSEEAEIVIDSGSLKISQGSVRL